ncbi:hypothetical protein LuPra_01652 [Luteitalea pratensis]|uniref:Nucleotidyltransferase n=1 Tax=Luteitalea pratensis TaxID=1855912 RepID=A0A143PIP7_LUTPR|nr:hypothetical protein [Luteitalea pratensis]AMY08452.1 hypothetical protein LuPra_01652 [Luteitalea pratensis]
MVELARDFDEFFSCLTAHNVEFVIVGAYALAFHGVPRFTGDIDVLIRPNRILQMGVEPVQIHVISSVSGVTWDEAWEGRKVGPWGDHELPFIGRREFIRNKRASGRLKDLADIEALGDDDPASD